MDHGGLACDATLAPAVNPHMLVEEVRLEYRVRFDEYDDSGWCWLVPFQQQSDVLRWGFVGITGYTHPCNPGCEFGVQSSIELHFEPGGTFTGTERTTFVAETPECDVPACGFPCEARAWHMVWGPPPVRRCGFDCETT